MSSLRSQLVHIAAEIARSIYREGDSADDYLGDLAIEARDLAVAVGQQTAVLAERTERLRLLRSFMTEVEWRDFCYDYPDAAEWFGKDGVPK